MKTFTTGALALLLLASSAATAFAQDGGGRGWRDGDPRNSGGHARQGAMVNRAPDPPAAQPEAQAAPAPDRGDRGDRRGGGGRWDGNRDAAQGQAAREGDRRGGDRQWDGNRDRGQVQRDGRRDGDRDRAVRDGRRDGDRDRAGRDGRWDGDRNPGYSNQRNWYASRDWQRERPRYDRRQYAPTYRAANRYRGPAWRPPSGFYARSWVFGDLLPRGWYGSQYRIAEWWEFDLPIPPIGYEWVRVGDDALLVDQYTGRVVQVAYDLFW